MKATAVSKSTDTTKFSESVVGVLTTTFDGGASSGGTTWVIFGVGLDFARGAALVASGSSADAGRESFGDAAGEADAGDDACAVSLSLTRDFPPLAPIAPCMCGAAGPEATRNQTPRQLLPVKRHRGKPGHNPEVKSSQVKASVWLSVVSVIRLDLTCPPQTPAYVAF